MSTGVLIDPRTSTLARFLELVYIDYHGEYIIDEKRRITPPLVPAVLADMIQRCSEFGVRDPGGADRPGGYQGGGVPGCL